MKIPRVFEGSGVIPRVHDSNSPVLDGNLPFLGIVCALPFLLQNLPFLCFLRKRVKFVLLILQACKNSTSNANLLQQLKKLDRISKIQDRLCLLRTLQTTKRDVSKVENQVGKLVLLAKSSQILDKKQQIPLRTKITITCIISRFSAAEGWNLWKVVFFINFLRTSLGVVFSVNTTATLPKHYKVSHTRHCQSIPNFGLNEVPG